MRKEQVMNTIDTVKTDRNLYIGGSDVSAIMGLSPFKTRWDLYRKRQR